MSLVTRTPTRAALYARTNRKNEASLHDQVRQARVRAEREEWMLVCRHQDDAVGGLVPISKRAGGQALMNDALAARFNVLIVTRIDRLSRDFSQQRTFIEMLESHGIRIIGTEDGYDSSDSSYKQVIRTCRGMIDEMYRNDLREKARRGLTQRAPRGTWGRLDHSGVASKTQSPAEVVGGQPQ